MWTIRTRYCHFNILQCDIWHLHVLVPCDILMVYDIAIILVQEYNIFVLVLAD